MLRLAYFSPLPPEHTGIADYSAELLPHLAQLADITLFHPRPEQVSSWLREDFTLREDILYPKQCGTFDLTIYQMGNSSYHTELYHRAMRYPGIVVLHDLVLHHFIDAITLQQGQEFGYIQTLCTTLGEEKGSMKQYLDEWQHLWLNEMPRPYLQAPLNQRLVNRSLTVLVHSQYVQEKLLAQGTKCPVQQIRQPMVRYEVNTRPQPLPWSESCVIFAALGQVTAAKQVGLALRAFARLYAELPQTRFLIIGEVITAEVDVGVLVQELGVGEAVHVTGFVPELEQFVGWLAAADVIVNLRYPTQGETSATALRGMAQGKPVIVFDHGWYRELPDAAAIKLPPLDEEAVYQAMRDLTLSPQKRQQMGDAAARHIQTHHQPTTVAAQITRLLQTYLTQLLETGLGVT